MTLRGLLMPTVFLGTGMIATAANLGWSVREWQTDEGLPNNTVTSLAQTPDGFLWIATPGSLARFDGTQFELLTPSQIVPGYHQNARAFVTARDGSLWMATAHGPVVRVKTDNTVEIFTNQLPDLIVRQMIEDGEGGIWLAYAGPQLRRIKDGRVQAFSEAQGLPSRDYSLSLARDRKGKVWFTRGGYVGQYENGRFRVLTELRGMSRMQLAGSREGGVWICGGSRLFKYKAGGRIEEIGAYENGPSHSTPTQVLEDRDGNIWIGTLHGGLFCHTAGGFERIETSYPQIQCLMQDAEGDIWAGTGGGGLERIRPCVVKLEGAGEGLPFESVESICEDSNGTMWAVTQNGLLARRTG
ncbi:MAG: hypothetical protein KGR98_04470, partial [Verrucomicrobia bacterium]|nr:hypothetical protein [Verrucomicrobiota bacterium]